MHTSITRLGAVPDHFQKVVKELLQKSSPREAVLAEARLWRKDPKNKKRRRLLKTYQILFWKKGQENEPKVYFHASLRGELWRYIKCWKNLLIPGVHLWKSLEWLVESGIFTTARIRMILLEEFEVTYEIGEKLITDIVDIKDPESEEALEKGCFTVIRAGRTDKWTSPVLPS